MVEKNNINQQSLRISYEPADSLLRVTSVGFDFLRKPLLSGWARSRNATIRGYNYAEIEVDNDGISSTYESLRKIASLAGLSLDSSEDLGTALAVAASEEAKFQQFAEYAHSVWRGDIEPAEFEPFVKTVESVCRGRKFYRLQLLSSYHLALSQNACNFSVPGAGKTSIVYATYAYLASLPRDHVKHINTLLVVGPLSSFKAWEDEFESIFGRPARSMRITGKVNIDERLDFLRNIDLRSREIELVMTSYATLAAMEKDFGRFMDHPNRNVMFVLDEAHYIKRSDGTWANAALRLAPKADSRIVLTGTPAPNGYEDLSNLFSFIYPNRNVIGFPPSTLRAMSNGSLPSAVPKLKERVKPFYTRIRKTDLDLPPTSLRTISAPMSESHASIYRNLERKIVPSFAQDFDHEYERSVRLRAKLMRLRQACVNPFLLTRPLADEELFDTEGDVFSVGELETAELIRGFDPSRDLMRLDILEEIANNVLEVEGKLVIWTYFLGNFDIIRERMETIAEQVDVISGSTPVAETDNFGEDWKQTREAIIERFHQNPGRSVLIANPQAVGESISLHHAARSAVFFDRDFNAGRFIQAKDRIHRYSPNDSKPVSYYFLASSDTVDEDIASRLEVKEARLTDLMDTDDIPLFTSFVGEGYDDIRKVIESYERRK